MFHAYCIIQNNKNLLAQDIAKLTDPLQVHIADQFLLQTDSIGIAQIRELRQFLNKTPYSSESKIAVVDIDICSPESQHALLKSLEEPPPRNTLILTASSEASVLPTILSRCIVITPQNSKLNDKFDRSSQEVVYWSYILNNTLGSRLLKTDELPTDRNELILWVNSCMKLFHQELHNSDENLFPGLTKYQCAGVLKLLMTTKSYLDKNISLKLTIDNLLLSIPSISN